MQVKNTSLGTKSGSAQVPDALHYFDELPDSAYVRLPVVTLLFGVSRATVWRWSKAGVITATRLSARTTGWNVGTIRQALKSVKH